MSRASPLWLAWLLFALAGTSACGSAEHAGPSEGSSDASDAIALLDTGESSGQDASPDHVSTGGTGGLGGSAGAGGHDASEAGGAGGSTTDSGSEAAGGGAGSDAGNSTKDSGSDGVGGTGGAGGDDASAVGGAGGSTADSGGEATAGAAGSDAGNSNTDSGSGAAGGTAGSDGGSDAGPPCTWGDATGCGPGEYCDAPGCGAGRCDAIPASSTGGYAPACGCDGLTYWNATLAALHGMSTLGSGECGFGSGIACGWNGSDTIPCLTNPASICAWSTVSSCGLDPSGMCWVLPAVCPAASSSQLVRQCSTQAPYPCIERCSAIKNYQQYYVDPACAP